LQELRTTPALFAQASCFAPRAAESLGTHGEASVLGGQAKL